MENASVDSRNNISNASRLSSIKEKAKQQEAQKLQIRNALHEFNNSERNPNRITFSDSDDEELKEDNSRPVAADGILGFDCDEDLNVTIEQRFTGKDTEKLLNLQSRYGNDSRFRLDSKFAEDSDTSIDEEMRDVGNVMTDEVTRNMHLVDQITGHATKLQRTKHIETFSAKSSLRYDPSVTKDMELNMLKSKKNSQPKRKNETLVSDAASPPDLNRFYDVSADALKNAFASKGEDSSAISHQSKPFSFIEALNLDPDVTTPDTKPVENAKETGNDYMDVNVSDESDNDTSSEDDIPMVMVPPCNNTGVGIPATTNTFFPLSVSDPSILNAAKNFCWNKPYSEMQREWLEVKDILIKDYKKKHRDAKKKRAED